MTVDEKLWKLASLLYQRTSSGQIKWEQTARKNSFLTAFPNHSVQIGYEEGGAMTPPLYRLSVFNEDGALVEDTTDLGIGATAERGAYPLSEIYALARRSAIGADAVLDELIAELS
jgi:hypothetical protein